MSGSIVDVVVAGGGLSGLACAEAIRRAAPEATLLCLEAAPRAGGCIETRRREGFLMESGPAGFLDKTGALKRLVAELGLEDQLVSSSDANRSRWVLRGGRLHRFPSSLASFATSDLVSARGKLRMLLEPLTPHRDPEAAGDETVREFATRRLGGEAADVLVDPIVAGIYAADSAQVSLQASLPHLAALESKRRSLFRALVGGAGKASPLTSFRHGCGQLIDALERRLAGAIACDAPVTSVARRAGGYTVTVGGASPRRIACRAVVSAAPAASASRYLDRIDPHEGPKIAWQLAQIRSASVAVVGFGFRQDQVPHPLGGFGYLVPSCESSSVLGVQWSSSIYPDHRAPAGCCLIRLFLGGAHWPLLAREADEVLFAEATAELARTLGVRARPVVRQVDRHIEAMPQYLIDHQRRVADIERRLTAIPGLFVGGNGLRGLGMDALVRDAERQAAAALAHLRSAPAADTATPEVRSAEVRR
jgi:oxygen-dependent protoporphyrinogen oxidase